MLIKEKIEERQKIRDEIASKGREPDTFLLISESLDDYLEQKIQNDKVVQGILKDIQGEMSVINMREELKWTFPQPLIIQTENSDFSKGAKMLKGIVKPNGEVVSMDSMPWQQKGAATQLFKAGLLCCVNENGAMIICHDGKEVPVTTQAPATKIVQGNNGEVPAEPPADQIPEPQGPQPAEPESPQPAEPEVSPNEPKPGAIKPFVLPAQRPSRKQARLDTE
jgi:hypothetical protein